jgi:hypothetical protein
MSQGVDDQIADHASYLQPVDQDPWEINGDIDTQRKVFRFDLWP